MLHNKKDSREKESGLMDILMFRYFPYWPLFAILLAVSLIIATTYLYFATPVYEATATILIKDEKKGADDSKMMESLNVFTSKKIVENEIEVIHSKTLMKDVVENLHLYAPIFEDGKIKGLSAYTSSPIIIKAQKPELLDEYSNIYFEYNEEAQNVTINKASYSLNQWVETPYGSLMFVPNPNLKKSTESPLYFNLAPSKYLPGELVKRLNVKPVNKLSTVVNISFKDEVPQRAADILNELTSVYKESSVVDKNSLATNTLAFIEERIMFVEKELDSIEKKIQKYKVQQGVVDLSAQGRLFLENVGLNDRKATDISMQLAMLDQAQRYVVSKDKGAGIVPSSLGINDPVLSQILQKLYNTEIEYNRLKKTTAENNPILASLSDEIEKLRPSILENIKNQRRSLMASQNDLTATNSKYSSVLQTIPQKERELLEISRQQTIKNNIYTFLLQKREEAALSTTSATADSKLIDAAESFTATPVYPKNIVIYLIAIVGALSIGFVFVSAKELLSNKIQFRSEIEEFTSIPVAAEISKIKSKTAKVVNQPDNQIIAEQFRQLRAAIGLFGRRATKKKLLVTSSIAGEGKSFVSTNLAISLALSGKKVILIDLDLRNPQTSATFELNNEKGVSEFLKGEKEPFEIIKKSEFNSLFIIPAGSPVSNPTEVLLNGQVDRLFNYLEEVFDYIIVDTSPVDPVTDAYVLSEYCDSTLYVIKHAYTPKAMVQLLDENYKIKALKNIAIVFNSVKTRGFINGGIGYGYGYENIYKDKVRTPNTLETKS